ncbi:aldehyde reductase [Acinetobacter sp. RF15A]|uniref:SDR family oxidoreductase n=1 Tax=unclassified Acinetobacter TaxID=196816 RepID=UPI001173EB2B|nr:MULTISPECIES: aldehyde reductase [unclassified Acinetobacter]TQR62195.1 aldehyde reductase [Acinetobacter sp. RF14B]TSH73871.1 aldehyde reductase [Acinetobacter sp. RF15A]TSI17159.1 aldehyde reductase [Acinetobacter sp. RF15B]
MTQPSTTAPVLVTGASGYIASWVIQKLLTQGYTVHATVRDLNKTQSFKHLEQIADSAPGTLKLFAANLLTPGSFDAAMQDCEIVFHMASPFVVTNYTDPVKDIIEPAVVGTENVLNSVNKTESVQRVVVTSSIASTYGDAIDILQTEQQRFDESHWNMTSSPHHQPYPYSKVMAERKAWEMAEAQDRWDLICINPALVFGKSLTPNTQSGSVEVLQQFANGLTLLGVPPMWNGVVDVQDVAEAHLLAAFNPEAEGRYIICSETLSLLEMGKILRKAFGAKFPFPRNQLPKTAFKMFGPLAGFSRKFVELNMGYPIYFNAQKSQDQLGIQYRPVQESLVEHFQQLLDDGLVKRYIP